MSWNLRDYILDILSTDSELRVEEIIEKIIKKHPDVHVSLTTDTVGKKLRVLQKFGEVSNYEDVEKITVQFRGKQVQRLYRFNRWFLNQLS